MKVVGEAVCAADNWTPLNEGLLGTPGFTFLRDPTDFEHFFETFREIFQMEHIDSKCREFNALSRDIRI